MRSAGYYRDKIDQWKDFLATTPDPTDALRHTARGLIAACQGCLSEIAADAAAPAALQLPPDEAAEQTRADAEYLARCLVDNVKWNHDGMPKEDLAVLFEMDWLACDVGPVGPRFTRAFRCLVDEGLAIKSGTRYHAPGVKRNERAPRECAARWCKRDISHLRADALFCSPKCRQFAGSRPGGRKPDKRQRTPRSQGTFSTEIAPHQTTTVSPAEGKVA